MPFAPLFAAAFAATLSPQCRYAAFDATILMLFFSLFDTLLLPPLIFFSMVHGSRRRYVAAMTLCR